MLYSPEIPLSVGMPFFILQILVATAILELPFVWWSYRKARQRTLERSLPYPIQPPRRGERLQNADYQRLWENANTRWNAGDWKPVWEKKVVRRAIERAQMYFLIVMLSAGGGSFIDSGYLWQRTTMGGFALVVVGICLIVIGIFGCVLRFGDAPRE